jgi:hypothetical protein
MLHFQSFAWMNPPSVRPGKGRDTGRELETSGRVP